MATLISVISFDDAERQLLAGDTKQRSDSARKIGNALNSQIKEVLTRAGKLADTNPSRDDLDTVKADLSGVRQILDALPAGEDRNELAATVAEIAGVVDSAIQALSA